MQKDNLPLPYTADSLDRMIDYILRHKDSDTNRLRLNKRAGAYDFDLDFAILQIELRRKDKAKLPKFLASDRTIFPTSVSYEQASCEAVASYRANLIPSGIKVIDLTAGLGIDSMAFAKAGHQVISVEYDAMKAAILRHNISELGLSSRITVINEDSMSWIKSQAHQDVVIYVDPARRGIENERVYALQDCQPNVIANLDSLFKVADRIFLKVSPMLDVTSLLKSLDSIHSIHVISYKGECKEILIELTKNGGLFQFNAVDINPLRNPLIFSFKPSCKTISPQKIVSYVKDTEVDTLSGMYIYEPNASVMKLGCWAELCERFNGLRKVGKNTHLFVSRLYYPDFPGRCLIVEDIIDKKGRRSLVGTSANVVVRNYPQSADKLRMALKLRDGGELFVYGFRFGDSEKTCLLKCTKAVEARSPQNLSPHDNTI